MPDVIAAVLVLTGVTLGLTGAVGVLRLPDALTRLHAQTKPAVLGLILVLAGTAVHVRDARLTGVVILSVLLQLATAPVGSHLLGRATYRETAQDHGPVTQRVPHKAKPEDPA